MNYSRMSERNKHLFPEDRLCAFGRTIANGIWLFFVGVAVVRNAQITIVIEKAKWIGIVHKY